MKTNLQAHLHQWELLWRVDPHYPQQQNSRFLFRIFTLIALYFVFNIFYTYFSSIPAQSYESSSIHWAFLKNLFTNKKSLALLPIFFVLGFFGRRAWSPWTVFSAHKALRLLILIPTILLAWVYATDEYNLFYNHSYALERWILTLFIPLVWYRPIFVLFFLPLLYPVIGQFSTLSGFSWALPSLPIQVLTLFSAFFFFYVLTKSHQMADFIFVIGCIFVTHYWPSGSSKMNWQWLQHDQISYILPATYANGWLGFLSPETIGSLTEKFALLNLPIKLLVLILEFGSILFFTHRKAARFFLIGFAFFHLGVFLVSGIFFWTWMIMDIALAFFLFYKSSFTQVFAYNKLPFILSIFLIIGSRYWNKTVTLFWYDVPVSYTYHFEAKAGDGNNYRLPPKFFAPYDYQFTLGGFDYINEAPLLDITWGTTADAAMAQSVKNITSADQFFEYEKQQGTNHYDPDNKIKLEYFIKRYILNWNERQSNRTLLSTLQAPRHLWTYPQKAFAEQPQAIQQVTIVETTSFYKDGQYTEIRSRPVQEIMIKN